MDGRTCSKCKVAKDADQFYVRKNGKLRSWCKACNLEASGEWSRDNPGVAAKRAKEWRANNLDLVRETRQRNKFKNYITDIKRKYGITEQQYARMLKVQCGGCAICGEGFDGKKTRPNVDHCHATGKVRGLLCRRCNILLGHVEDDSALLTEALEYLGGSKCGTSASQ